MKEKYCQRLGLVNIVFGEWDDCNTGSFGKVKYVYNFYVFFFKIWVCKQITNLLLIKINC